MLSDFLEDLDALDDDEVDAASAPPSTTLSTHNHHLPQHHLKQQTDTAQTQAAATQTLTHKHITASETLEARARTLLADVDAAEATSADTHALLVATNRMVVDLQTDVESLAKLTRDAYAPRFRELESLVPDPLDYARAVLRLGNAEDPAQVDLSSILPSATVMVVTVSASTTLGSPLADEALERVTSLCERVLVLSDLREQFLAFVKSLMSRMASNVSAIVGTEVAAKLVGAAGGLGKLAQLPANVVQVLGRQRRSLAGMSTATTVSHAGSIEEADLVINTPPAVREKVMRMVAAKVTLAARADAYCTSRQGGGAGELGGRLRDEIEARAAKLAEPNPRKEVKALPVPADFSGRQKRGGRKARKVKARMGMTQMHELANRVRFGEAEDTTSDGLLGVGMLGKEHQSGKIKVKAQQQPLLSEKKRARLAGSSGATNGLASSLAFTTVQGIELVNPAAPGNAAAASSADTADGTESYFSKTAAFYSSRML